ncbi:DUF6920 family protein [Neobacillus sp. Marseille-QA0830]
MKRILFLIIVVLHGLIHLLGFVKAFNIKEVEQLAGYISRPIGVIWLVTAVLFLTVAVLYVLKNHTVWLYCFIAVLISQTLIVISWQDAKFGSLPNLLIFIFAIFSYADWIFNAQAKKEVQLLLKSARSSNKTTLITEQMLTPLPTSVQKWLRQIGVIGRPSIQNAYFKQKVEMKLKPDQKKWAPAIAEQYVTTYSPGFLWKVHMKILPIIQVAGRDKYMDGKAEMLIKIGGLLPLVDIAGSEKVTQSTLQRFLLEMPWYPTAALNPYISWEDIDKKTAKATLDYKGVSGSATFYFDDSGNFVKASARRFKESDDTSGPIKCIGQAIESNTIDGVKIPTKLTVTWMMENGPFTWYKVEIIKGKYNL